MERVAPSARRILERRISPRLNTMLRTIVPRDARLTGLAAILFSLILTANVARADAVQSGISCTTFGVCDACAACTDCRSREACPPAAPVKPCPAPVTVGGVRPQDQVWLLSTRHLGGEACGQERPNWQVWRRDRGRWATSNHESLLAPFPAARTVIYVHGNRVDADYAVEGGLRVYRNLIPCADDAPIRFIIWSWCADQIKGQLKDVRYKAEVADGQAVLFGRFLAQFPEHEHVGVIGYSYGARIVTGGLHLVGGGEWCGYRLGVKQPADFHVVLWAAAENNTWLSPWGCHRAAVPICGDWLIMINGCDKALKRYHLVEKGAQALGYTGLYGANQWGEYAAGIRQTHVEHLVGPEHLSRLYPLSPTVMTLTRAVVLRPAPLTVEVIPTP